MSSIKKITAHVAKTTKQSKAEIIFRILITILEIVPGVLVAVFTDLGMPEKVAIASAIGAIISGIVNVVKESGLLTGSFPEGRQDQ